MADGGEKLGVDMPEKGSSELLDNGKRILLNYGANSYIIKKEYNADELAKLGDLSFNIDFAGGPENYFNSLSDRKSEIAERIKSGETTITQELNRLDEIKNQKELVLWTLFYLVLIE